MPGPGPCGASASARARRGACSRRSNVSRGRATRRGAEPSLLLALALASPEPLNVAVAVALHVIVGQLVGQAMVDEYDGDTEPVRVRSHERLLRELSES